jgi:metallophosphoesterase superfamily enzyme
VVRVSAPGERLRLPCFVTSPRGIVLPAFGDFTGGSEMKRGPQRHLVATWEGALIDLG